ncbi:MAG TPA: hypothetical protein VIK71_05410 [Flavobacteriales bacterium]|jgi:hypothetical protein
MKTRFTFYAIVLVAMFFGSFTSYAQTTENNPVNDHLLYIHTDDITVEKFQSLQLLLKTNTDYQIAEACVPAKIISVKNLKSKEADIAFADVKALLSSAQIKSVSLASDYNDQKFLDKCISARRAN